MLPKHIILTIICYEVNLLLCHFYSRTTAATAAASDKPRQRKPPSKETLTLGARRDPAPEQASKQSAKKKKKSDHQNNNGKQSAACTKVFLALAPALVTVLVTAPVAVVASRGKVYHIHRAYSRVEMSTIFQ